MKRNIDTYQHRRELNKPAQKATPGLSRFEITRGLALRQNKSQLEKLVPSAMRHLLTPWQTDFIKSLRSVKYRFTKKQQEKLQEIANSINTK